MVLANSSINQLKNLTVDLMKQFFPIFLLETRGATGIAGEENIRHIQADCGEAGTGVRSDNGVDTSRQGAPAEQICLPAQFARRNGEDCKIRGNEICTLFEFSTSLLNLLTTDMKEQMRNL